MVSGKGSFPWVAVSYLLTTHLYGPFLVYVGEEKDKMSDQLSDVSPYEDTNFFRSGPHPHVLI